MKPAKNPKLTLSAGQPTLQEAPKYPEQADDAPPKTVNEPVVRYEATVSPEMRRFRSSLPYQLMGCAEGPMSQMTDDEIKAMMVREKYGL